MKPSHKSFTLLLLTTLFIGSQTRAQSYFHWDLLHQSPRVKEVMQDNEYVINANTSGSFFCNPLILNGKPLDYNQFSLQSKGELSLVKNVTLTGQTIQIPFYVYLRRLGTLIKLPGEDVSKSHHVKLEISTILKLAEPGDQLIIEPVNNSDWRAKRILKLLKAGGC